MIVSEIYETMAGDRYGVVLNEDIKIIRIGKINDRELTPDFFRRARMGLLTLLRRPTKLTSFRSGSVWTRTTSQPIICTIF